MTTDPIADLLVRIKNASMAKQQKLVVDHSAVKEAIVKILVKNGFLTEYQVEGKKPQLSLKLTLKYRQRQPVLKQFKRLSKPGVRHYAKSKNLNQLIKGRGLIIISTSKGLLPIKEARALKLGGELVCRVY